MYTPSDEELSAYLDSELDAVATARVEDALANNALVATRLESLRVANERATALFSAIDERPIPAAIDALLKGSGTHTSEAEVVSQGREESNVLSFPHRQRSFVQVLTRIAATVVIGAGVAFLALDNGENPAHTALSSANDIDAEMVQFLDSAITGERVSVSDSFTGFVSLSFESNEGGYCREAFSVTVDGSSRGLYCKDAGDWSTVATENLGDGTAQQFSLASADESGIDAYIDRLNSKGQLAPEQEREAIARRWAN